MQRKVLTLKKVLTMGAIIGLSVIAIAYFAIYMQHRRAIEASRQGTLPRAAELAAVRFYANDSEGDHSYSLEQPKAGSSENLRAWSKLVYTQDGKKSYIQRRRERNIFVEGFDRLVHRNVLYEFKCQTDPREYAIIEVFEVDDQGKTLDYAKTGSSKDWGPIPEGTTIEKLAQTVCPSLKN